MIMFLPLLIVVYLFFYYASGKIVCTLLHLEEGRIFTTVYGFFCYFTLFFVIALPMKFLRLPLHVLTGVWSVVLAVILCGYAYLVYNKYTEEERKKELESLTEKKDLPYRLTLLAGILLMVLLFNCNDADGAIWDGAYYIGDANTSVYTDTISGHDPYTGDYLETLNPEYQFEVLQNHSAVVCMLTDYPALLEMRTVLGSVNIILFYLIVILFSRFFFPDSRKQQLLFFALFILLDLMNYNLHVRAQILLFRAYEGKAVQANIIIWGIFYLFVRLLKDRENLAFWILAVVSIAGCCGVNMTSILTIPALTAAAFVPLIIAKREGRLVLRTALLYVPLIPVVAIYLWGKL